MIAEHVQIPRFGAQEHHKEDDKPVSSVCVMWCSQRSVSTGTFFCYICFTICTFVGYQSDSVAAKASVQTGR